MFQVLMKFFLNFSKITLLKLYGISTDFFEDHLNPFQQSQWCNVYGGK